MIGFAYRLTHPLERAARATPSSLNPGPDFWTASILCIAQAFSPNPDRPPFFVDLPFERRDGRLQPCEPAHQRWTEHMPLYLVEDRLDGLA